MKFTLTWLRKHLDTTATVEDVVDAMTMAGLEVEHVDDPAAKLAGFTKKSNAPRLIASNAAASSS